MNSVVQALVHTPPLAHCLLTMSLDQLLGPFGRANGFCAVRSMAALTKRCLKERTPTAPTEFIKNLKRKFFFPCPSGKNHFFDLIGILLAINRVCKASASRSTGRLSRVPPVSSGGNAAIMCRRRRFKTVSRLRTRTVIRMLVF